MLNKNKELLDKIHYQDEQIEGLKIVINKFADEREKILFKEKKNSSNNNIIRNFSSEDEIVFYMLKIEVQFIFYQKRSVQLPNKYLGDSNHANIGFYLKHQSENVSENIGYNR